MQNFIYDIDRKVFRNSSGLVRTSFRPSISYGERSVWSIEIQATDAGQVSLGGATAWRAAIDQDFNSSTEPMARTTSGITVDASGEWPVAVVAIDTLTERFLSVCDGRQTTPVYFELAGLDANGDTVFYLCFAMDALFPIDPAAAGTLAPVTVTTMTESQVQAIAAAAGAAAAQDAATSAAAEVDEKLTAHSSDTAIHVPTSGSAGQVLTKTASGTEWKDASTGDASGYTLPAATSSTLGGVKVGSGLSVTEDGTLSSTAEEAVWGDISGTLSEQADLSAALSEKADASALAAIQTTASAAQDAIGSHSSDTAIHVPTSGSAGQVLTKTASGTEWKDASTGDASGYTLPAATSSTLGGVKVGSGLSVTEDGTLSASQTTGADSITEFSTTYREWTQDDVGKLFRYTGETSGQFFKGRLYQGVHWKTSNAQVDDFNYDNVEVPASGDDSGDTSATTVSYVVVATGEFSGYSGAYTLSSGSDGSTGAVYAGDNGKYIWYGTNDAATACWVCGNAVNAGAAPANNPYIYSATDSITGSWYTSDSDYSGGVTSVTRQETTGSSTSNAADSSSSSSTSDAFPDWPMTFTVSGPVLSATTGTEYASGTSTYARYSQAFGTYYRTGDTFTTCGEEVPVWSNGVCYVHAIQYSTALTENTEPTVGLFIPEVGKTYTPAYENIRNTTTSLYRLKSAVTRPSSGGTVTTEDSSDGVPSSENGDLWACMTMVDLTIKETYSSTGGGTWPPEDNCGQNTTSNCVEFWEDHYGCAIVTTGASRDWTDEQEEWEANQTPNLTCYPGGRYYASVAADSTRTLNAGTYAGPPLAECDVVLKIEAGGAVSCGSSVTLRGSLVAGQVNFCRLVWTGNGAATLIVQ